MTDLYQFAEHYDAMYSEISDDIGFYERTAARLGGPILELACGTGRITRPLAGAGFHVTGVDREEAMLGLARKSKVDGAEYVRGDMRNVELGKTYPLVLLPFNSLGHLHDRSDIEAMCRCVHAHLARGGRFVVAMFNPKLSFLTRDPDDVRKFASYTHPETGVPVTVSEQVTYDRATQVLQATLTHKTGTDEFSSSLSLRMFFPQELEALLHYGGFRIEERYGDFDESAFASSSPHQILITSAI